MKLGSTIVTLKAAALQKLTKGSHTVTVNFDDDKATIDLTIKAASGIGGQDSVPKTDDNSRPDLWLTFLSDWPWLCDGLREEEKDLQIIHRHKHLKYGDGI